jgi:hypothetical protein
MRSKTALLIASLLVLPLTACQVRQTEEGEMPEVEVKGGNVPEYDVDTADVEVTGRETEVTVPDVDVDVKGEQRTITVPDVDVKSPDQNRQEEAAEGEDPNR